MPIVDFRSATQARHKGQDIVKVMHKGLVLFEKQITQEWSPLDLGSNLIDYFDASDISNHQLTNGSLDFWNGANGTVLSGGQSLLSEDTINGLPAIHFEPTTFLTGLPTLPNGYGIATVVNLVRGKRLAGLFGGGSNYLPIMDSRNTNTNVARFVTDGGTVNYNSLNITSNGNPPTEMNRRGIHNAIAQDQGVCVIMRDLAQSIGLTVGRSSGQYSIRGEVGALVFFKASTSEADILRLQTYLMDKWTI